MPETPTAAPAPPTPAPSPVVTALQDALARVQARAQAPSGAAAPAAPRPSPAAPVPSPAPPAAATVPPAAPPDLEAAITKARAEARDEVSRHFQSVTDRRIAALEGDLDRRVQAAVQARESSLTQQRREGELEQLYSTDPEAYAREVRADRVRERLLADERTRLEHELRPRLHEESLTEAYRAVGEAVFSLPELQQLSAEQVSQLNGARFAQEAYPLKAWLTAALDLLSTARLSAALPAKVEATVKDVLATRQASELAQQRGQQASGDTAEPGDRGGDTEPVDLNDVLRRMATSRSPQEKQQLFRQHQAAMMAAAKAAPRQPLRAGYQGHSL